MVGRRPPRGWRAGGRSPRRQERQLRRRAAPARGPVQAPCVAAATSPSRGALWTLSAPLQEAADATAATTVPAVRRLVRLRQEEDAGEALELQGHGPQLGRAVVGGLVVVLLLLRTPRVTGL